MSLYIESYNNVTAWVDFCGYKIPMPDLPDLSLVNSHEDGKFHHVVIPDELRIPPRKSDDEDLFNRKRHLRTQEWHKRLNGEWWLLKISNDAKEHIKFPKELMIKDRVLIYIPGLHYFFLNHWTLPQGNKPDFYWAQNTLSTWWGTKIVSDDKCNGGFVLKGRRLFFTQWAACMQYEYASRVRNVHCGMQNVNVKDVKQTNYDPIIQSHREMIWFFKPINQGTDQPQNGLIFRYPEKKMTNKGLKEMEEYGVYETEEEDRAKELNSRITYAPTKAKAYNKARLERYVLDEPGQMTQDDMNPVECLSYVRPSTELKNGKVIIGKILAGTTVAEMGNTDYVLKNIIQIWEESDTEKKDALGKTTNGLKHIFVPSSLSGDIDEFGFPLIEQNTYEIEATRENLRKLRKWQNLADYKRTYPLTIEDVLTPSATACHFNLIALQDRHKELMRLKAEGDTRMPVKVRLVWTQRFRSVDIIQVPDAEEGDDIAWCSYFPTPEERNKVIEGFDGKLKPGNTEKFAIGIDTYDHEIDPETAQHELSDGALVVRRRFDSAIDANKLIPNTGFPSDDPQHENYLGRGMESRRTILTFRFRYKDPDAFYEFCAKACILFGSMANPEANKITIKKFFKDNGLLHFIKHDRQGNAGTYSSTPTIQHYFDLISVSVEHFINNEWHSEIIEEYMKMQKQKMTKFDLGVASGMAHILESEPISKIKKFEGDKQINYYAKRKRVLNFND